MSWFGVVSLYAHAPEDGKHVVEERVVLFQARDADEALAKAEAEARRYEGDGVRWLGSLNAFACFDDRIGDGCEVFSLLRKTPRTPEQFDDVFFADAFAKDA